MSVPRLPEILEIRPFRGPVKGSVTLPGSKSLTNRALLLATMSPSPVELTGALFSEDTELMTAALKNLGFQVEADPAQSRIRIGNQRASFQQSAPVEIDTGLAGTTARFLTARCAVAAQGVYRLDGVPQMRKRPMKGLIDALRLLGAEIRCLGEEGFFPIEIHARGLQGGVVPLESGASSQLLSALLMVAPWASGPVTVQMIGGVRWPFVRMTASLMQTFQRSPDPAVRMREGDCVEVAHRPYQPAAVLAIEPDATAASYFAALPIVTGGHLALANLHPGLQGDTAFLEILQQTGLTVSHTPEGVLVSGSAEDVYTGVTASFNEFSDTFLTYAALAPLFQGPTTITGIAHSRLQETDRVAGMVTELRRLGQEVEEHEDGDGLTIRPRPLRPGQIVETYADHRFAMSFGILGTHDLHGNGQPWLSIRNPACCAKTFPHFFDTLESLRPAPDHG